MKAVRIHRHGGPEVLELDQIPTPQIRPDQVLLRVIAFSINHLDLFTRAGMPGVTLPLPLILGCDGTGQVIELGENVKGLQLGQLVVIEPGYTSGKSREDLEGNDHLAPDYSIRGEHGDGIASEFTAVEAKYAMPLPDGIDPIRAAAVPLVFITAWGMLVERARLTKGETVLVLGGASGVGSAAIQIARHAGARVIATAGSDHKRALCRDLGAEAALDHGVAGWEKEVRKLTDGRGCDVVVEHVGPATWDASMRCLARNGRLVTCGGTTGPKVSITLPHLFIKNQSVLGSTMGPRRAFPEIFEHIRAGRYRPVIDRVMPMSRVREAHELLESRGAIGKIVLTPHA